jgi:hypothetical protein
MVKKQNPKELNNWAYVVTAMLSVNQYSALGIYDNLESNGLFDLPNLATWSYQEIFKRLEDSGYKRGDFLTGSLAGRLKSLGSLAESLGENEKILANGSKAEVTALLSKVKGIGPVVISNFLLLRGSKFP